MNKISIVDDLKNIYNKEMLVAVLQFLRRHVSNTRTSSNYETKDSTTRGSAFYMEMC